MAQCQFSTPQKPVCKAHALTDQEYCRIHAQMVGLLDEPEAAPYIPPGARHTEPAASRPGRPAPAVEAPPPPRTERRLDPATLLRHQQERLADRQASMALPMPDGYQVSSEEVGARIAVMLRARETREREAAMRRGAPRRDAREEYEGMRLDDGDPEAARRPMKVLTRRQIPDPTRIIDPVTKQRPASMRDDFVHRWVAVEDGHGRPNETRIATMEDYGYEFIRDERGEPIESRFGVAMQGPPEAYANRMIDRSPEGAYQRDQALQGADAIAQEINRRLGDDRAVTVVNERDHGRTSSAVPLGQEHLHDV